MNKNFGVPNWVRNYGFYSFVKVALLFFLNIAQDCSLGQCQTSRVKTSKKKIGDPNRGRNDISYSNVVKGLLKLACFLLACFR